MKINSDLLIDSKVEGTFYANDFKCRNLLDIKQLSKIAMQVGLSINSNGALYSTSPASDVRAWGYSNSNWIITLPKGNYTLTFRFSTQVTVTSAALRVYNNSGALLFNGDIRNVNEYSRTFILSQETTIGIMAKTFDGVCTVQLESGAKTSYTPFKAFENDYTLRDIQTFRNEGISWDKAVTYSTAADVPAWYSLITLTLNPKKTGTYLFNYSIPVLAVSGGTPFLDFHINGINRHRAYISNVSNYTNMTPAAITGSFVIDGLSLSSLHSVDIGISKNNSIGYRVSAGYPITVTALEI